MELEDALLLLLLYQLTQLQLENALLVIAARPFSASHALPVSSLASHGHSWSMGRQHLHSQRGQPYEALLLLLLLLIVACHRLTTQLQLELEDVLLVIVIVARPFSASHALSVSSLVSQCLACVECIHHHQRHPRHCCCYSGIHPNRDRNNSAGAGSRSRSRSCVVAGPAKSSHWIHVN